jgi:hypothetical protein
MTKWMRFTLYPLLFNGFLVKLRPQSCQEEKFASQPNPGSMGRVKGESSGIGLKVKQTMEE